MAHFDAKALFLRLILWAKVTPLCHHLGPRVHPPVDSIFDIPTPNRHANNMVQRLQYILLTAVLWLGLAVSASASLSYAYDVNSQAKTQASVVNPNRIAVRRFTAIDSQGRLRAFCAHQRRVKTQEGATVRYNIYDAAGTLVQVYDAATDTRTDYVSGPNGALARIKRTGGTESVSYIHADHLGTGRVGTDAAGTVTWEDFHTPFGESLLHPDATDDQGDYTGHIRDKSTGLTYMQARYYDPLIGRFLAEDPMNMLTMEMNPGYFGRYSYTFNDPVNFIDPDGQQSSEFAKTGKSSTIVCMGMCHGNDRSQHRQATDQELVPLYITAAGVEMAIDGPLPFGDALAAATLLPRIAPKVDTINDIIKHTDPRNLKATEKLRSKKNRDRLAKDMKENGFDESNPIEVVNDGGRLLIKDGHHRTSAAIKAGIKDIPYKEVDVSPAELKQLRDGFGNGLR